jgi:hypothetical protein
MTISKRRARLKRKLKESFAITTLQDFCFETVAKFMSSIFDLY